MFIVQNLYLFHVELYADFDEVAQVVKQYMQRLYSLSHMSVASRWDQPFAVHICLWLSGRGRVRGGPPLNVGQMSGSPTKRGSLMTGNFWTQGKGSKGSKSSAATAETRRTSKVTSARGQDVAIPVLKRYWHVGSLSPTAVAKISAAATGLQICGANFCAENRAKARPRRIFFNWQRCVAHTFYTFYEWRGARGPSNCNFTLPVIV